MQGVSEADLQMGPGHYPGTPLPGYKGNVGIAGHRTTFGAPFFRLNELVPGDLIYLTDTSDSTWVYRVTHQWVVPPSDVGVLGPTNGAELTLTTCNPRFEATSRLVVRAVLTSELRPGTVSASLPKAGHAPGAPPSTAPLSSPTTGAPTRTASAGTVPPRTAPSRTVPAVTAPAVTAPARAHPAAPGKDAASLAPAGGGWWATLGWGGLALAVWVAARVSAARVARARQGAQRGAPGWRRGRHMGLLVLVAGALVCLVPLWFTFENAVRLLPANF